METLAVFGRQVVSTATITALAATSTALSAVEPLCTSIRLPKDGVLILNENTTLTLSQDAVFESNCNTDTRDRPGNTASIIIGARDHPFHASTIPQVFVLGSMLFLAWVLVFILIITPRTYFIVGSPNGGILGRRGMLGGATGTSSVIGVGGRPWLQKVATLGVGISLLIATINSFDVTREQYARGVENADELTSRVVGSIELQIIRTISFTFLWLAQVQTLIRLFPRHKEKVIIKWVGFALIFLDTLFAIVNSFVVKNPITKVPQSFDNAIAALAYMFQLALNFVYLCAVLAYSWAKRRFAFYHPKMRNVSVVAFISVCSIVIPLVFFVIDVIMPDYIGWGDYVRWVGAAAASVVVWEWVERVEALEREERKDGILGREIFDGDEEPYSSSAIELRWPKNRRLGPRKPSNNSSRGSDSIGENGKRGDGDGDGGDQSGGSSWFSGSTLFSGSLLGRLPFVRSTLSGTRASSEKTPSYTYQRRHNEPRLTHHRGVDDAPQASNSEPIQVPPNVASPVSRADTTSAASTVYAVVHSPPVESDTPSLPPRQTPSNASPTQSQPSPSELQHHTHPHTSAYDFSQTQRNSMNPPVTQHKQITPPSPPPQPGPDAPHGISYNPFSRSSLHNPFKRQRTAPPPEVTAAMASATSNQPTPEKKRKRDRFRLAAANYVEPRDLPTFDIPAREDGGAWSPQEGSSSDKDVESNYLKAVESRSGNVSYHTTPPGSSGRDAEGDGMRVPGSLAQMPSIDGTLNAHARWSPLDNNPGPTGSVQSTPSPRPPPSLGGSGFGQGAQAERMPTLQESGLSGESAPNNI